MVTIGIDPHKQTHSGVAVDPLGVQLAQRTVSARREGFGELVEWARALDRERVWVVEDVRHVSGPLERFLLERRDDRASPASLDGQRPPRSPRAREV